MEWLLNKLRICAGGVVRHYRDALRLSWDKIREEGRGDEFVPLELRGGPYDGSIYPAPKNAAENHDEVILFVPVDFEMRQAAFYERPQPDATWAEFHRVDQIDFPQSPESL